MQDCDLASLKSIRYNVRRKHCIIIVRSVRSTHQVFVLYLFLDEGLKGTLRAATYSGLATRLTSLDSLSFDHSQYLTYFRDSSKSTEARLFFFFDFSYTAVIIMGVQNSQGADSSKITKLSRQGIGPTRGIPKFPG